MNKAEWQLLARLGVVMILLVLCLIVWWPMVGGGDRASGSSLRASVAHWWSGVSDNNLSDVPLLTVAFLDVGQGDAIFIETFDGVQMLIDGGPDMSVLRELGYQLPITDRTLDVVLGTHSDLDHIGGLVEVLGRYEVASVITTTQRNDTAVADALDTAINAEETIVHLAQAGDVISLGASTTFTILSPAGDPTSWESNNASIVGILRYGEVDFLLTGDAGTGIEEYLVDTYSTALESDVLKLGHHGSRTSSSLRFLQTVSPTYAIVSAGSDNSYGHPHPEVIENVALVGALVRSTAEAGTVVFQSNGREVWEVR